MIDLKGHGVALITPFADDHEIDFVALGIHIEHLIGSGIDYLVVMGTTAESVTLKAKEKEQIQSFVVDTVAGRLPLVIGIGGNNTQAVVEEIESTDLSPFSAILSVCPYYNKPNQEGLFQHFSALAKSTSKPLILYNVPGRTACNLTPATVTRLAEQHDTIIAIKEASGDMIQIQDLIRLTPERFQVLSGDDALAVPVLLAGGVGVISVIGNLLPERFSQMIHWAHSYRVKEAYQEQYAMLDLINLLFQEGNPTGVKAALSLKTVCQNKLRLPLVPASPSLMASLQQEISLLEVIS
ncbi:MAG: 4-hydroxy-tetrahydrodipicolinate synthase [Flavobacteriaceae bacterium]